MQEYYCLDIEFNNVDFNIYGVQVQEKVASKHHAHLSIKEVDNEIELKIFYNPQTYFGDKFMNWNQHLWGKKIGSFFHATYTPNASYSNLKSIDFSDTIILRANNSSSFIEKECKYILLNLSTVKLYWQPVKEKGFGGEFYFADRGFKVVNPFYSFFSHKNSNKNEYSFFISRMKDSQGFYCLKNSKFRPEYDFILKDGKNEKTATVEKRPKIHFEYKKNVAENDAVLYGDIVLLMASFYHHLKIEYIYRCIRLKEHTITIYNVENKNYIEKNGNLWDFGLCGDFNDFLQTQWQGGVLKNFSILLKAISMFNESHIVYNTSKFLIRFGVIEICGKYKEQNNSWNFKNKTEEELKIFFEEIKNSIANIIVDDEQEAFYKKWSNLEKSIKSKSIRKQLEDTLIKNNIDITKLPITTNKIVTMRNDIVHGSIKGVNEDELEIANNTLYNICGRMILNLMGV